MKIIRLQTLAESLGLIIKIQMRETLGLNFFRVVVAEQNNNYVKIWGEMKGWTLPNKKGLQLDTLKVLRNSPPLISELIWAATMAWALENTPCKSARLLAIYDQEGYSKKLVRYFRMIGFTITREVGSNPSDLLLRLIWGGAGTLMSGECESILKKMEIKFEKLNLIQPA
tara:strand:+ start:499 stop:1008 length:510 start_codon:yes stop_codon:yes gene_type:complete